MKFIYIKTNQLNMKENQQLNNQNTKNNLKQYVRECTYFMALVLSIYACYLISGIYHQKILKNQYLDPNTGTKSYFQQPIIFTLFPQLIATIIGYLYKFYTRNSETTGTPLTQKKPVPWKNALICGLVVNFNMYTYNLAVVEASFPAVVMVKSCSLLSVILVGVFCSRVQDKNLKLKQNKIMIGLVACVGIFIFNYFKKSQKDSVDRPIQLFSSIILVASLIGDGFLPDLQAQIKSIYKPTVMEMYLAINQATFLVSFSYVAISGKLFAFIDFFMNHDEIFVDIVTLSVLNAVGQIVIYKMIKLYKQHIPAFVIGIRKCLTVVINIIYFGHSINILQLIAIIFVFCAIMWETYDNYLQKLSKQSQQKKLPQSPKFVLLKSQAGDEMQLQKSSISLMMDDQIQHSHFQHQNNNLKTSRKNSIQLNHESMDETTPLPK